MARAPTGNAKTHSTPSRDDGVEHKELPSPPPPPPRPPPWDQDDVGVKPQAEAPHSVLVAPRGALRRRLRRRTCTARAHSAPSISAAATRALRPSWSAVRVRTGPAWSPSSSPPRRRARQGARRQERAGRWQMERMLIPLIWSAISTISRAMALPPAASSLSLASASASLRDNANMNALSASRRHRSDSSSRAPLPALPNPMP